jgi:hypothetical protein
MAKDEKYYPRNKGPKKFSQRYTRKRYDDPDSEIEQRSKHFEYVEPDIEFDECWDPRNYSSAFDYNSLFIQVGEYDYDADHFQFHHIVLEEIIKPFESPFREINKKYTFEDLPEYLSKTGNNDYNKLELQLRFYISRLRKLYTEENSDTLIREIRQAIGSNKDLKVVRRVAKLYGSEVFSKLVCFFAPFWLQRPQAWDPNGNITLLQHLFIQYEVPIFLEKEWINDSRYTNEINFKWLIWFIILGQGGSLKSAAKYFFWRIPSKFSFFLSDTPSNISPVEACIYAEVMRLGGTEKDVRRILTNGAYVIDPTGDDKVIAINPQDPFDPNALFNSFSFPTFWESTVRWMIRHSDEITDDESQLILNWAMHEYTDCIRCGESFSWRGRSPRRVLELSHEYRSQISKPWHNLKWNRRGWDWEVEENPLLKWSFIELVSGEDLFNEGQALHHCVSSYAGICTAGRAAIVSLRRNNERCVTIEIGPSARRIVQVRGLQNREANAEEKAIISEWLKTVVRKDGDT